MKFSVMTLFPEFFDAFLSSSIIGRAQNSNLIDIQIHNIRDYSSNKHKKVDDYPYGGGAGMVMAVQPLRDCLKSISNVDDVDEKTFVIYMSPRGKRLTQDLVKDLARKSHIVITCGHYEGVDQRYIDRYVDEEISIGDYVLTGGEIPAMVLIDSISRMNKGVLSNDTSKEEESFYNGLLEYPHYTRPAEIDGDRVPNVLISGNHKLIDEWRNEESIRVTKERRPDLIK